MKTLNKHIIREVFFVTLVSFFIFTFFLIMNSLFVMSDLVIKYGISVLKVIELLFLLLPSTVAVTVPMAFLVGVLLTYSRLVQDNEYHGMQACGISTNDITKPTIMLALAVTFIMILFNNYLLPAANLSYKKLYFEIVKKRSSIIIQEHTFVNDFDNYVFYIGEKDNKNDLLKNVIVFVKSEDPSSPSKVILSREGELINDAESMRLALKLKDGTVQVGSYDDPGKLNQIFFGTNMVDLDIKGALRNNNTPADLKGTREMTARELLSEISKGTGSKQDKNWLFVELHKKFSIPFAVLAFAFVAIPLGLLTKKGGKVTGISFSLVLIFVYYILLSMGSTYGYRGQMNYFLAVWLPNIFLVVTGILVLLFILLKPLFKRRLAR
ncbi:MAG: LptF/LptG family permease [Spirochaetia bacterium]|nr:LptF/LptG family permease [Spirochaetia bacterium]